MNIETKTELTNTIEKLIDSGFRFTMIHNADENKITIVSVIKPDQIKHKFPDFHIRLDTRNTKMVERFFFY